MIWLFRFFFTNFTDAFHNKPGGWSGRKLFSFGGSVVAAWVTYKYAEGSNAVEMVVTWLTAALLALGIITAQQVIELKTGKKEPPTEAGG